MTTDDWIRSELRRVDAEDNERAREVIIGRTAGWPTPDDADDYVADVGNGMRKTLKYVTAEDIARMEPSLRRTWERLGRPQPAH